MFMELLRQIVEVCIVPLLGILTTYFVKFVKVKIDELTEKTDSEILNKYLSMLNDTVSQCVIATNQTYVNALKEKDIFSKEAQEQAFAMTKTAILNILNEEAKDYLAQFYGDLNLLVDKKIEMCVNLNKIG